MQRALLITPFFDTLFFMEIIGPTFSLRLKQAFFVLLPILK